MWDAGAETDLQRGLAALEKGKTTAALAFLERAARVGDNPVCLSCLGYCLARERGQVKAGMEKCRTAIEQDPGNPVHHLNLGRILLLAGARQEAIDTFRRGLALGRDARLVAELEALGIRRKPVLPFLRRNHPVNKILGLIRSRIGRNPPPAIHAAVMVLGLFSAATAVRAAADYPMFRGDLGRTGYLAEGPQPPLKLLWKFQTGKGLGEIEAYPAADDGLSSASVSGGTVYVGGHDGNIYALDLKTGARKMSFETKGRVNSTPSVGEGLVVAGSMDGVLYALRASDFSLAWKFNSRSYLFKAINYRGIRSSPLIQGGVVYFGA